MCVPEKAPDGQEKDFRVTVTCELTNGEKASAEYTVHVPKVGVSAGYLDKNVKTVAYGEVGSNGKLGIVFTVLEDGNTVTDAAKVKSLVRKIDCSPAGNDVKIEYRTDGTIVCVPEKAPDGQEKDFRVTVTCELTNGEKASAEYTVHVPEVSVSADYLDKNVKTVAYGEVGSSGKLGIVFTVLEDGNAVTDMAKVKSLVRKIGCSTAGNDVKVEYRTDGTIVCVPEKAPDGQEKDFKVTVTCELTNGEKASAEYTVCMPEKKLVSTTESTVLLSGISENTASAVIFVLYEDGSPVTDAGRVKALQPKAEYLPEGNGGMLAVDDLGRIVCTPDRAPEGKKDFTVTVTCTLSDGTTGQGTYQVIVPGYSIQASFADQGITSVRLSEIASNTDLCLLFTVLEDGKPVSDRSRVETLQPEVTYSPEGNGGKTEIDEQGRIVCTPNTAKAPGSVEIFPVTVTVRLGYDGTEASVEYRVYMPDYRVLPLSELDPISRLGFFENSTAAAFEVTKDGRRLGESDLQGKLEVSLDEKSKLLLVRYSVADDGTIRCVPYSEQEAKVNWKNWWKFYAIYWSQPGRETTVTLTTPWGQAKQSIPIEEASLSFRLMNVWAPLVLEALIVAFLLYWIIAILAKPRFARRAKLYVGTIRYNADQTTHLIRNMRCVDLATEFNTLRYRWKPVLKAEIVKAEGIRLQADGADRILCLEDMPWHKGKVKPLNGISAKPDVLNSYILKT